MFLNIYNILYTYYRSSNLHIISAISIFELCQAHHIPNVINSFTQFFCRVPSPIYPLYVGQQFKEYDSIPHWTSRSSG
jgi:hypothetical protein